MRGLWTHFYLRKLGGILFKLGVLMCPRRFRRVGAIIRPVHQIDRDVIGVRVDTHQHAPTTPLEIFNPVPEINLIVSNPNHDLHLRVKL